MGRRWGWGRDGGGKEEIQLEKELLNWLNLKTGAYPVYPNCKDRMKPMPRKGLRNPLWELERFEGLSHST